MNNDPAFISDKSIVSSLFQIASRADAPPVARPESIHHRRTLAELMLNPRRLEAILNAVVKRKKAASR